MTSFSHDYPVAYHVFPLHAAKGLWKSEELLSKQGRDAAGLTFARPTTSNIDRLLGFGDVVHFYLPPRGRSVDVLPILRAQLGTSKVPPFPHAVLKIETAQLSDDACLLCCWNIAVSRPQVSSRDIKGGNWARGTKATRILEVWQWFREANPSIKAARGQWAPGFEVPVVQGVDATDTLRQLNSDQRRMPELLLQSPFPIRLRATISVFSEDDEMCLRILGTPPSGISVSRECFPGYNGAPQTIYDAITTYFKSESLSPPRFDFDAVRPSGGEDRKDDLDDAEGTTGIDT